MSGLMHFFGSGEDVTAKGVRESLDRLRERGHIAILGYDEDGEPRYMLTDEGEENVEEILAGQEVNSDEAVAYVKERAGDLTGDRLGFTVADMLGQLRQVSGANTEPTTRKEP